MINDLSNVNNSMIDSGYPGYPLFSVLEKMNSWQLLQEAALAFPRSSLKEKLLFYIEEGRRMEGHEALSRMQQIVIFLLPRVKKWRLSFETQQALDSLRYYLDHSSATRSNFSV